MEIYQFQNLLNQVDAITARYKKINELTGENFNVFRILKLESSEVRMHSAFIAELLNPDGSHGQKDTFLKLFIKDFCFKDNLIDTASCKVKVEEYIGTITEDKTQGGRIDITIKDKHNQQIIIENKIYANDQNYQLTRYYNHSNNADIIYLTLYGKPPNDNSKGELENGIHFKCYSYKHDVLAWLESCRKEAVTYPIIREGITHYINLVKYLTNQTLNQNMQEELTDLLKLNIEASFLISDNLDYACEKVSQDFGKQIIQECEKNNLICEYGFNFETRYSTVWIWRPDWKYVSIGFSFQNYDKDLIYGLTIDDPNLFPIEIRNQFINLKNNRSKSSEWWPWFMRFEDPYNNWSKFPAWQAILNGTMQEIMFEKINYLLEVTSELEM